MRSLLADLIDYAGLFPPAKLDMGPAVETYNRCKMGEHEWMLGRFVVPLARIAEFEKAASPLMPGSFATSGYREMADAGQPWQLSVLVEPAPDGDISDALDAIEAFNERHAHERAGLATIDMCEIKVADANTVDLIMDQMIEDVFPSPKIAAALSPHFRAVPPEPKSAQAASSATPSPRPMKSPRSSTPASPAKSPSKPPQACTIPCGAPSA